MLKATFVVRNQLQAALYRVLVEAPYFTEVEGQAAWLHLVQGLASDYAEGGAEVTVAECGPLVGQLGGLRDWRSRRRALRAFRAAIGAHFERWRPGVVVLANDRPFAERAVIEVARQFGIPTVLIQDGLIPTWNELSWPNRVRGLVANALRAAGVSVVGASTVGLGVTDYCGVMGQRWLSVVRSRSGRPGTVQVVGQPLFDSTVAAARQGRQAPAAGAPFRVLYLATDFAMGLKDQRAHADQLADIRLLAALLGEVLGDGAALVVRPHPLESDLLFDDLADLWPRVQVRSDDSLDAAITASDLVVSSVSSASLAAIAARWPCLVFGVHLNRRPFAHLMRLFPCVRATSVRVARDMLRGFLDPERRAAWVARNAALVEDYVYVTPDRTASEMVVRLLATAAGADPRARRRPVALPAR